MQKLMPRTMAVVILLTLLSTLSSSFAEDKSPKIMTNCPKGHVNVNGFCLAPEGMDVQKTPTAPIYCPNGVVVSPGVCRVPPGGVRG